MRRGATAAIIVVGGTVAAVLFGPNGPLGGFWHPLGIQLKPAGWELASLIGSGLVEAVGVGLALAILTVGRPWFTRFTTPSRATALQLASAWLLGSWWPHSALHLHFGPDASALAGIEPVFHAGSVVVACVLVWSFVSSAARPALQPAPDSAGSAVEPVGHVGHQ